MVPFPLDSPFPLNSSCEPEQLPTAMFSIGTRESFHNSVIDTGGSLLKPRF